MIDTVKNDIRILIADDHEIFRDGFKLMLSKQKDIFLLGEASNGQELLTLAKQHMPDVIITDIKMPTMDGIEATQKLIALYPDLGIIGLSMFNEDDLVIDMLEAGAKGYLLKNANKEQILEAIRTVYNGDAYYCKSTSYKLTQLIVKSKFNPYKKKIDAEFTEKELELIHLVCQQYTNKQIGEKLLLSIRTVEGMRLKIMEKMNVNNLIGLVIYAMKNGLVKSF